MTPEDFARIDIDTLRTYAMIFDWPRYGAPASRACQAAARALLCEIDRRVERLKVANDAARDRQLLRQRIERDLPPQHAFDTQGFQP